MLFLCSVPDPVIAPHLCSASRTLHHLASHIFHSSTPCLLPFKHSDPLASPWTIHAHSHLRVFHWLSPLPGMLFSYICLRYLLCSKHYFSMSPYQPFGFLFTVGPSLTLDFGMILIHTWTFLVVPLLKPILYHLKSSLNHKPKTTPLKWWQWVPGENGHLLSGSVALKQLSPQLAVVICPCLVSGDTYPSNTGIFVSMKSINLLSVNM